MPREEWSYTQSIGRDLDLIVNLPKQITHTIFVGTIHKENVIYINLGL